MLMGLVVCVAVPAMQRLVVTSREQVKDVCLSLVKATEAGDVKGIGRHVAGDFRVHEIDRSRFLEKVAATLTRFTVEQARLGGIEIVVSEGEAVAEFRVSCRIIGPEDVEGNVPSAWRLRFRLTGDQWQMTSVEPLPTPLFPYDRLEQLFR